MSDNNQLNLTIKLSNDTRYTVSIESSSTVKQLKEKIDTEHAISADRQILIYSGKVLKDEEILTACKVTDGQTIHLVKSSKPSGDSSTSSQPAAKSAPSTESTAPNTTPTTTQTQTQTQPDAQPNLFGAFGANPFGQNTNANANNPLGGLNPNMFGDLGANPFGNAGGLGGAPNMQGMQQMMNNPEVMNMMTSMLANPEMARLVINSNPQLQGMGVTPEMLSNMVSNPLFQSLMANPEMARSMAQFSNSGSPFGANPAANPTGNQNTTNPTNPTNPENRSQNLAQLLSQMPQLGSAPSQPVANPEERYQNELAQLREMGFTDPVKNVRALLASGGDVNLAIEYLFNSP